MPSIRFSAGSLRQWWLQVGTWAWAAPEMLLGQPCSERIDIWRCVALQPFWLVALLEQSCLVKEFCGPGLGYCRGPWLPAL